MQYSKYQICLKTHTNNTRMVPRLDNSWLILCVFVETRAVKRQTICNLVFPKGGSITPTVVGIWLYFCWNEKCHQLFIEKTIRMKREVTNQICSSEKPCQQTLFGCISKSYLLITCGEMTIIPAVVILQFH